MQGFLTVTNRALAYHDLEATQTPQLKAFDWALSVKAISVEDPRGHGGSIPAGSSATVFDGTRSTTIDGTSAFSSELSTLDAGTRYRFTWTGGTNPTLRTDRALTLSGSDVTIALNADSTVNMSLSAGAFTGVIVGDIVYIPGVATGDAAGPFSESNVGFWTVIAVVAADELQLSRPSGTSFEATGETVTLAANTELQAFSAAGVQAGDNVTISAGFASPSRRTYTVDRVTSTWFEVLSTAAIAAETGKMPGAAGMLFYTDAKRFLRIEVDQLAVIQLNGDTGETNSIEPLQAGDRRLPGWFEKLGPVYKLVIVNKASTILNYVGQSAR